MGADPRVLVNLILIITGMYGAMFVIILIGTHYQRKGTIMGRIRVTLDPIIDKLYGAFDRAESALGVAAHKFTRSIHAIHAAILRRKAAEATSERAEHGDHGVDELNVAAALASVDLTEVARNPGEPVRVWTP